jgi:prepilin-type N-terminal cleavage/methylation domain-containing protein
VPRTVPIRRFLPRGEAGFTLLEVMLVVLVIGMMLAVAYPRFRNLGGGDVKTEARTLIGRIQGLYAEATFTRRTHRLVYDLDERRYWGETQTEGGGFTPVERTFMAPVALPAGVDIKDVTTERAGRRDEGKAYTYFLPLGRADLTTIHLEQEGDGELTLQVNPLTGKVRVEKGYVERWEG